MFFSWRTLVPLYKARVYWTQIHSDYIWVARKERCWAKIHKPFRWPTLRAWDGVTTGLLSEEAFRSAPRWRINLKELWWTDSNGDILWNEDFEREDFSHRSTLPSGRNQIVGHAVSDSCDQILLFEKRRWNKLKPFLLTEIGQALGTYHKRRNLILRPSNIRKLSWMFIFVFHIKVQEMNHRKMVFHQTTNWHGKTLIIHSNEMKCFSQKKYSSIIFFKDFFSQNRFLYSGENISGDA